MKIFSRMSIRGRFLVPVVLMACFAAYIFYVFPSMERRTSMEALENKAVSIARMLAFNLAASMEFQDQDSATKMFNGAALDGDVGFIVLSDADGVQFADYSRDGEKPDGIIYIPDAFETRESDRYIEVEGPLLNLKDRPIGSIRLGMFKKRVDDKYDENLRTSLLLSLSVACIASMVLYLFGRQIAAPITALASAAERIANEYMTALAVEAQFMADGDLTREINQKHEHLSVQTGGEVGQVSDSFNLMLDKLGEIASAFSLVSTGLRDIVIHVQDAADEVAAGSNNVARSTGVAVERNETTVEAVNGIAATIHEMSVSTQNAARGAQSQAASSTETLASIDNLIRSVRAAAQLAARLVEIANSANQAVEEGRQAMSVASQGIAEIRDVIQTSSDFAKSLGEMADDIGKIVGVIDDIAEQTNLLALNAAIEAARAGEHGLGFAVVADEVRKLAERSAASTGDISDLVRRIQTQVEEAVRNSEKSTVIVEEGRRRTDYLRANLNNIEKAVSEVFSCSKEIGAVTAEQSAGTQQIVQATSRLSELTQEITAATEEHSEGADQVFKSIEQLRLMVQDNAGGAGDLASSAEELTQQSTMMRKLVSRFKVETNVGNKR